jgi:hypothetical protein
VEDLTDKSPHALQLVMPGRRQHGVTHVLAAASNLAQVSENAKAGDLNAGSRDLARIRKASSPWAPAKGKAEAHAGNG